MTKADLSYYQIRRELDEFLSSIQYMAMEKKVKNREIAVAEAEEALAIAQKRKVFNYAVILRFLDTEFHKYNKDFLPYYAEKHEFGTITYFGYSEKPFIAPESQENKRTLILCKNIYFSHELIAAIWLNQPSEKFIKELDNFFYIFLGKKGIYEDNCYAFKDIYDIYCRDD